MILVYVELEDLVQTIIELLLGNMLTVVRVIPVTIWTMQLLTARHVLNTILVMT